MKSKNIDTLKLMETKEQLIKKKEARPDKLSELYNIDNNWDNVIKAYIENNPEYQYSNQILYATDEFIKNQSEHLSTADKKFITNIIKCMREEDVFIHSTKLVKKGATAKTGAKRLCLIKCGGCEKPYVIYFEVSKYSGNCYICCQKDKACNRSIEIKKYIEILSNYGYTMFKTRQFYTHKSTIEICCPKNHKTEIVAENIKSFKNSIECLQCNTIYNRIVVDKKENNELKVEDITGKGKHDAEKIKKMIEDNGGVVETIRKTTVIYWCQEKLHILTCEPRTKLIDNNLFHCESCRLKNSEKSKSQQISVKTVGELMAKNKFELKSDYVNSSGILKLYCTSCALHMYISYKNWLKEKACTNCKIKIKKSITSVEQKLALGQIFKEEVEKYGYKLLDNFDKYDTNTTKFNVECDYGHVYETCQDNFVNRKRRCPSCQNSQGEDFIEKYLTERKIAFKKEFSFPDGECKHIYNLRFDFYLKHNNKEYMIEFDGEQHFKPIEYFGGEKSYRKLFNNDCRKTIYCVNTANIPLLRVAFNDFDKLTPLLDKFLSMNTVGILFSNVETYKTIIAELEQNEIIDILT